MKPQVTLILRVVDMPQRLPFFTENMYIGDASTKHHLGGYMDSSLITQYEMAAREWTKLVLQVEMMAHG